MIDALINGKLIKAPELKTSQNGKAYCSFLLSVAVGEEQPIVVSAISFGEVAERIAKLGKGDSLAVIGSLKPTTWQDKATNETKHGLNITVNNSLSVYDIKKRRPQESGNTSSHNERPFNDNLNF
ncbi:MAG: single-stranded DNA-binding protein [Methylococcales bacterium]|nr:single-stranded DNA-binding protein [Methylococcales bacterium]